MKKIRTQFSVILCIALCNSLTSCTKSIKREAEIYLIPEDYIGMFYIVYNVPTGEPVKYENGARLFQMPSNGVLFTQAPPNTGWINSREIKYYYQTNTGDRKEIIARWSQSLNDTPENRADNRVTILGVSIGVTGWTPSCDIVHSQFIVATKSDVLDDKVYFELNGPRGLQRLPESVIRQSCD